jgi:hypothetical protein
MWTSEVPKAGAGRFLGRLARGRGERIKLLRSRLAHGSSAPEEAGRMIVLGGYVRSRLRELIFGGVMQALPRLSPVPLLLS